MKFEEYRVKTKQFAMFKGDEYPFSSLIEEIGELTGKLSKHIRENGGTLESTIASVREGKLPELKQKLTLELGDCFWMFARMCELAPKAAFKYPITDADFESTSVGSYSHITSAMQLALSLLTAYIEDDFTDNDHMCVLAWRLADIASGLNINVQECWEKNIEKLLGRTDRGTIAGEGDYR